MTVSRNLNKEINNQSQDSLLRTSGRKRPTEKPEVFNPNAFENRCQADTIISLKTGMKRETQPDVTTQ